MENNIRFIRNIRKTILLILFFVVGTVFSFAYAQDFFSIDVNIQNTAVSYQGNNITVSFDLTNGEGAQSGIKYGVQLKENDVVIDEKVYNEILNIGENEILSKKIQYEAPDFLQGEYNLQLVAKNDAGASLAIALVGEVVLNGTGDYLQIDDSSCYVSIQGDGGIKYTLKQGVDILSEEVLFLTCRVANNFNEKIDFTTLSKTYYRSTFGDEFDVIKPQENNIFSIKPNETKEISFIIYRPVIPQAYDTTLFLVDIDTQKTISNPITTHYVVRGESATIQNIQLDKVDYLVGEVAKVSFSWTPSADHFEGSRMGSGTELSDVVVEGIIEGCSETFYYTPEKNIFSVLVVNVPIIKECQNPKVSLSIKSGDQILDEAVLDIESKKKDLQMFLGFGVIILIILFIIIFMKIRKGKKGVFQGVKMLLLCLMLFGTVTMLGGVREAKGASFAGAIPNSSNGYGAFFTYSINMNGDPINVVFQGLHSGGCNNAYLTLANGYIEVIHDNLSEGKTMSIIEEFRLNPAYYRFGLHIKQSPLSFSKKESPGIHTVTLKFYAGENTLECNQSDMGITYCMPTKKDINYQYIGKKDYTYTVADQTPTCSASWDDNGQGITVGETSTLTWSASSNAVLASAICVGPSPISVDWGNMGVNGSYPMTFDTAGTETCTITVKNSSGTIATCSDSLTISPAAVVNLPTCKLKWTPSNISEDGGSTIEWESTGADSATYECEGLVPLGLNNLGTADVAGGSYAFNFDGFGKGTETCYLKFTNSAGTKPCEATVTIEGGDYSCTGSIPDGYEAYDIEESTGLTVDTDWTFSTSDTSTKCQYKSSSGSYSCTGTRPAGTTICSGDTSNLTSNLSWQSGCTNSRKCEYYTNTVYSCTGTRPSGTEICSGDTTGLTSDLPWMDIGNTSSDCTLGRKCEYYQTVVYECTGTRPADTEICSGDTTGLTSDLPWMDIGNTSSDCTLGRKCEYYQPCIPTTWEPSPTETCDGVELIQTSNCETTRTVTGTKDCPSCTANFNPASVMTPGSSTLTWNSQFADDIKYTCTGPVSGGADYGTIPLNSPTTPAVVFDFDFGPSEIESCTFTVKDDSGEIGTCITNGNTTGGVIITPHPPTCTLEHDDEDGIIFVGDEMTLIWTSEYASSATIDRGVGSITPVASSSIVVYPTVVVTSDISYTATFSGYGGSVNCSTDSITVVADPPKILNGSFEVHNQKTGLEPKAKWSTDNVVSCDLASDTGYSKTDACSDESSCSSVIDFEINKTIMEETEYTLTCYNLAGYGDTAVSRPLGYFEMTAEPTEVEVDFAGGGATTEPGIGVGLVSWNGYRGDVSFTADLSELPESPGDETTNSYTFSPVALTFSDYFTNGIKSILRVFASYRFTGEKMITIWGNGTESIDIVITSDQTTPIYEPI